MSGIKRRSPSGFAAAAKVLFESAQKTGALKPLQNNTKLYAHQLKKIQNQSRKRGGSLGSVSYKVAEFLATQRQPSAITPLRNATSIATKVPLLNIPLADGKQYAVKVEDTAQLLDKIVETEALVTDNAAPSLSSEVAKKKIVEKAASSPGSFFPEVLITEDKPAFELRSLQASPAQSIFSVTTGAEKSVHRPTQPLPTVSVPLVPQLSVPKVDNASEISVEANFFSVDLWERQREQELQRLKLKQTEAEQSRLAVLREDEHRTLGLDWVKQRSKTFLNADLTFTEASLCNIEKAHSPKEALVHLQVLVDAGSRAANAVGPAAVRIALQISRLRAPRLELERELSEIVDKGKLSAEFKAKISLLLCMDPEKFIETYRGLPAAVQSSLDKSLVNKAVRFFASSGHWEEAISMIDDYSTRGTDRDGSLGVILANSCARAEKGVREAVSNHLNRSLAASGRLGKSIRLALTRLETGHQRRNLLTQLAASPDADESVYAELIKHSDTNSIPNILNDVETRGLYKEDPLILDALAFRSISHEDPMACFNEIERQAQSGGVRVGHVNTALIAARAYPSPDTLKAAIAVVKRLPHYCSRRVMNILAPRLFAEGMHAEVGELVDVISPFIDISAEVPDCIGFVNDSLRALDRSPFSEATAKNKKAVLPVTSQGDLKIGKVVTRDLSALTDRMLSYAKDKQWQAALEVVTSLNITQERDCNMPALTLLFNCALSAAVDSPELVLSILDLMKERQVTLNSTTVNTVLSSLSKSQSSWEAALPFFEETAVSSRDNNTYLVMLSLLGRHGRWDAAAAVFDDLRKTESKPPTSVFSILIGATAHHSWSYTLRVFQDMLKIHRSGVKDTVATQVIRCLEQNGRTMELKSLEKELAKKSKKKH